MASSIIPIQLSALGNSVSVFLPVKSTNSATGLQVVMTGTGTYNVQVSMYDPNWVNQTLYPEAIYQTLIPSGVYNTDAIFQNHATLNGLVAPGNATPIGVIGNLIIPCVAIRLNCSAYTSGSAILIVQPSAYPG